MTQRYLLPCTCGQQLAVSLRQAGESITCPCGNVLEVPSLNQIKALEKVAETEPPAGTPLVRKRSSWTGRKAGFFVGIVLLSTSIPWAGWLELSKPRLIPIDRMTPLQTWGLWQELRTGANRYPSPQARMYAEALGQNRNWFVVSLALAACGALICVGSYALLKPPPG